MEIYEGVIKIRNPNIINESIITICLSDVLNLDEWLRTWPLVSDTDVVTIKLKVYMITLFIESKATNGMINPVTWSSQ